MEGDAVNEISYLTRLIEQHKKISTNHRSLVTHQDRGSYYPSHPLYATDKQTGGNYGYAKPLLPSGRVHLNPNFKPKVPGIHVNPRIGTKSSVYVNPKMMKNFSVQNSNKQSAEFNLFKQNGLVQTKIEHSVHVNPKLMKELSSAKEKLRNSTKSGENLSAESKTVKSDNPPVVQSKTKLVKVNSSLNPATRRFSGSNLVSLSRRKLVRVRRSSKTGSAVSPANPGRARKLSNSNLRKTKVATKYKLVMECVNASGRVSSVWQSLKNPQAALNKYKIDRTHIEKVKKRLSVGKSGANPVNNKTASGSTTGLVRIGGILYKSSRNQLVRSRSDLQPAKRKRCIINVKGDRFVMASNGKKLRRLNTTGDGSKNIKYPSLVSRVDIGGMTFLEKTPNVLVRAHTKNNISTKAKQRSIQILRNKMRKNNQPCLIFQKFGYCTGQAKGTCPKLHDKKQVALCKNFLQGKCLLDNCSMSHAVCPEKMPTCKYFLEGCCIRDQCPYLHVKVSSNTPICEQFIRGYCAKGNKCKHRHVYVCPDFERSRNCAKGKYCPYPHKPNSSEYKKSNKTLQRKIANKKKISKLGTVSAPLSQAEDRKRYYDEAGGSTEDLEKKRKAILNSIKIIKGVKMAEVHGDDTELLKINEDNKSTAVKSGEDNYESDEENTCPKRAPLGPLPAYIPID